MAAFVWKVDMKAFPSSSSPSSSSSSNSSRVDVEYELRVQRKYVWVEQATGGERRVLAVTTADPAADEVRTLRPTCPTVGEHLVPLDPFNCASFGIFEVDISLSRNVREEMVRFVCNAARQAKIAGNGCLKIAFTIILCYPRILPPPTSSPQHDDDLERAVRESLESSEAQRNTRLSPEEAASIFKKLKKVRRYGSCSSEEDVNFGDFSGDCRICLEELLEEEMELSITPCGHSFHSACIQRWLTIAASCPICRFHLHCR